MCKPDEQTQGAAHAPDAHDAQERVLRVSGIVNDSITDGPGLRLAIFLQGCPRRCPGCHNPGALELEGGTMYTTAQLFELVKQNPLLSGVTLSGGEPFLQAGALIPLALQIRQAGMALAVYTGYTLEELLLGGAGPHAKELLALTDTLVDGPYIEAERDLSLPFRGSKNQRILNAQRSLAAGGPVLEDDPGWM